MDFDQNVANLEPVHSVRVKGKPHFKRRRRMIKFQIDRLKRVLKSLNLIAKESTPRWIVWPTLLAACRQDWVAFDFDEVKFPLEPIASDEAEWEVYEHHFEEKVLGKKAFRLIRKMGYRLCGPRRAMEFIIGYPSIQLDRPVIVTARWQSREGLWCAPVFCGSIGKREVNVCGLARDFDPCYGWLVLRRRAQDFWRLVST